MDRNEVSTIINAMVNYARIGDNSPYSAGLEIYTVSNNNVSVEFIGNEAIEYYLNGLNRLHAFNEDIEKSVSIKVFEQSIIDIFYELKSNYRSCKFEDFKKLINGLLALEISEFRILAELHGVTMESAELQFGKFHLYNIEHTKDFILGSYPATNFTELFLSRRKSDIFIEVTVNARDSSKAFEIAEKYFETFENVMSYMVADIFNNRRVTVSRSMDIPQTRIIRGNSTTHFNSHLDINIKFAAEHTHLRNPAVGNDKVWSLIFKKDKTCIEKRLMQSIEWIGKGVNDRNKSRALVQFVFGIESMLQYQEKNIITPSIVEQLSDWLAFIEKEDSKDRKQTYEMFKKIYQLRSAVVHGSTKSIFIDEVQNALTIAKDMVIAFLVKEPYRDMKSMEELRKHMLSLRFQ